MSDDQNWSVRPGELRGNRYVRPFPGVVVMSCVPDDYRRSNALVVTSAGRVRIMLVHEVCHSELVSPDLSKR